MDSTSSFGRRLDRIFTKDADNAQAMSLFAVPARSGRPDGGREADFACRAYLLMIKTQTRRHEHNARQLPFFVHGSCAAARAITGCSWARWWESTPLASRAVVAIFCRKMLSGQPCTIYGDGTQTGDSIFVDDVVSAFLTARERGGGELVNVGQRPGTCRQRTPRKARRAHGHALRAHLCPRAPGELHAHRGRPLEGRGRPRVEAGDGA